MRVSGTPIELPSDAEAAGYSHTLEEILQQPSTWVDTCNRMRRASVALDGIASLVLTGSGSSEFAGECVRPALQRELGIPVEVIDGGTLLMHGADVLPPGKPCLVVSLARSGNSPESSGGVDRLLAEAPHSRHLILTCNSDGRLARVYRNNTRVQVVTLDPRTNDRSLVMTSSFTNLVLAARCLGVFENRQCDELAEACRKLLMQYYQPAARIGGADFDRVVYLTAGPDRGAVHEAALKMLEMTAGHVATIAETYLGLRHGPMSFAGDHTLFVCFLSARTDFREYEYDLIRELNRKQLGCGKVLVGENIDGAILGGSDLAIEIPGMNALGDDNAAVLHVVAGQLLAFFRCRKAGLKPDSPSERGIISRVVEDFPIHRAVV